jgi:hypothetical protein
LNIIGNRCRYVTESAAYQTVLVLGIVTFPLALVAERAGVSLPVGRLVERLGEAHERAAES